MRNIGRAAAIAALGLSGAACSPDEYRPLAEDEVVTIAVHGYSAPFVRDGVEYRGDAEAYVRKTDPSNAFGVREIGDGEYLPDTFVVRSGQEEVELRCYFWHDSYPEDDLIAAMCRGYLSRAEPGQAIQVRFNDFDGFEVVMPELPELTTPEEDSEFSLSSGEDLVLSWEPLGTDDRMGWSLGPVSFDDPGPCVDDVSWDRSDGFTEDTGSFIVPKESYPTGLPAEGCQALLRFDRGRLGTTDPAIQRGSILARQQYKVRITLKP
ncbi:hypothetical protein SOCEGT47_077320 [Sorangium cellulosum]|uniref:Uncharacterized protein n=1 Tax=Sorangium cellulosum TaxID=56 RepID=A0A4V0NES1_SORCE|nr:hypothetical protein [Sorangium cellulosum]AUX27152.1 hypothetical protein SOCEGT47_077320 [Sorangium cellulosum]